MIADKVIDYVVNTTGITRILMRSKYRQREIIDAKQIVRKHHEPLSLTDLHLLLCREGRTPTSTNDTTHMPSMW